MHALFDDTEQSCLIRAEGKYSEAKFLQDCSYFEYYYRMMQHNIYFERRNEANKPQPQQP